jgi:hypothetical protein
MIETTSRTIDTTFQPKYGMLEGETPKLRIPTTDEKGAKPGLNAIHSLPSLPV